VPPDSPLLPPLIALFEEKTVPGWLSLRARLAARWRLVATGRSGIAKLPWGSCGPHALTAVASKHGLADVALPAEVLYPVRWQERTGSGTRPSGSRT